MEQTRAALGLRGQIGSTKSTAISPSNDDVNGRECGANTLSDERDLP